ncbi:MAG: PfkB family carbohydrate kinase [Chloroflexi bacterium]|nr:PfkB family carbohydrate kinase [Chloroflexota bacterium]
MDVSVIGAAAFLDYIYPVDQLPEPGQFGHILRDPGEPYCGGGAPNTACALARLGHAVELYFPVGEEFPGSACEQSWRRLGVDLTHVSVVPGERSGFAYLFLHSSGEALSFGLPGAARRAAPVASANLAGRVVIGPVMMGYTRALLEQAVQANRQVIFNGVVAPPVLDYLEGIDTFVVSLKEAEMLCRLLEIETLDQLAGRLSGARIYVTRGAAGSTLYARGRSYAIPAIRPDAVVDPTGAGDAYTAGVVSGMLRGLDAELAGLLGAAVSSFVVEQYGAQTNLPDWRAVLRRLSQQAPGAAAELTDK